MAYEIELKLELDGDDMSSVAMLPWLNALADGPGSRERLCSVYYDTGRFDLRDEGMSLRVRRVGERRVQTIKAGANGKAGPFARQEWEHEIAGDQPDLALAKAMAPRPLIGKKLARRLHPVFETSVRRCSLPLRLRDGIVELAIDRGHIQAGTLSSPVHELELELKDGSPLALMEVAERLASDLPVSFGFRSKADRGYALAEGRPGSAVHGETIRLDPRISVADGFRAIGMSCLRHLATNRDLVGLGDAEAIHQMRVGIRRLCAALSVFKGIAEDAKLCEIKSGLRWLLGQLGDARDLDVFVKETVAPLMAARPDQPGLGDLKTMLEARRGAAFETARQAMRSDAFRQLVLRTALWLSGGPWSRDLNPARVARRRRPLLALARNVLERRTRKIVAKARQPASLDPGRRHKLRVAIKKLRYATEFFSGLFPGRKAARRRAAFGKALTQLQDGLGRLNDIAVHERLADDLVPNAAGNSGRAASYAMGFISGLEQTDIEPLLERVARAGRRLRKLPAFWDV
jgi:inorganic triphosphatase YgiF